MLKNRASNKPGFSMKLPKGVWDVFFFLEVGSVWESTGYLSAGTGRCTSNPFSRRSQNSSWLAASGNLPAIPTMAIFASFFNVLPDAGTGRETHVLESSKVTWATEDFKAETTLLARLVGPTAITCASLAFPELQYFKTL